MQQNERYSTKISHLIIQSNNKNKFFYKIFVAKPSEHKEKVLGKLFGLIEIKSKSRMSASLADFIIEQIKTNYYFQKSISADIQEIFEKALHQTNIALTEYIEENRIKISLLKINIIIGIINDKNLYFTQAGKMSAFLIYYQQKNNYQITEISQYDPISEDQEINPLKFFSHLVYGQINSLDFLLFSIPNILNHLSLEKIKNIIAGNIYSEIIKNFQELLSPFTSQEAFPILIITLDIIKAEDKNIDSLKNFNFYKAAKADSMNNLMQTQARTQKLLKPSLSNGIKKYSQFFGNLIIKSLDKAKKKLSRPKMVNKTSDSDSLLIKNDTAPKKNYFKFFKKLSAKPNITDESPAEKRMEKYSETKTIKPKIKKISFNFFWEKIFLKIFESLWRIVKRIYNKFKKLPILSKVSLVIFAVVAILLIQNITKTNIQELKEQEIKNYDQIITEIVQKKDAAQASLIYQDEKNARLMLVQAQELIVNLPSKFTNSQEIINLKKEISQELEKLRREINIEDPILIANLKNVDPKIISAPIALKITDILYTQDQNNQAIYKINLETRTITATHLPELTDKNFYTGIIFNNEIIFLDEDQKMFSFNLNDSLTPLEIKLNPESKIVAIKTYNNRLYLLDPINNQISRYRKNETLLNQSSQWLKNKEDLSNAVDLAIDGNIYVIKNNGEIMKFTQGVKVNFPKIVTDPPLASPSKIKTDENSNYLYLLDPPTKRLVVINKEGDLIIQYTSAMFDDLKDFAVTEKDKKIYILNGSSVFGIPTEHL